MSNGGAYWDLKICALSAATVEAPVGLTKEEMLAIYEAAKENIMDCSESICSLVAALTDATEGETEQEILDENEVEVSTKSSGASVNSFVGTIAAVVVALIALNLN